MALLNIAASVANVLAVAEPKGLWEWLIRGFGSFIPSYGLCIIVFTACLRILLLPVDFFQRKIAIDNKKKTELMQPYMDKIQRAYAGDRLAMQSKQRELQKKFKYSAFGACLPAIVSMVIFLTMFTGMRNLANYAIVNSYEQPKFDYLVAATGSKYKSDEDLLLFSDEKFFEAASARYAGLFNENGELFYQDENTDTVSVTKPFELDAEHFGWLNKESGRDGLLIYNRPNGIYEFKGLAEAVIIAAAVSETDPPYPFTNADGEPLMIGDEPKEISKREFIVYDALIRDLRQTEAEEFFEKVSARYDGLFNENGELSGEDENNNIVSITAPVKLDAEHFGWLNQEGGRDGRLADIGSKGIYDFEGLEKAVIKAAATSEADTPYTFTTTAGESKEISRREFIVYDAIVKDLGRDAAYEEYKDNQRTGFLWIKNVWLPDAAYTLVDCRSFQIVKPVPATADFSRLIPTGCSGYGASFKDYKTNFNMSEYTLIMGKAIGDPDLNAGVNGYYILVVLVVALSVLSTKLNAAGNPMPTPQPGQDGAPGGAGMSKMMLWMMPIMMALFALTSNAIFSLYMVTNSAMALLSTAVCGWAIKRYGRKKEAAGGNLKGGNGGTGAARPKYTRYEKK
ncbi:MAG: YidC/Oxa1 family membrane protein insertase [Clostridiales bacterium]|jgi:membrane protein insertase Oxa1/YidC/SpoIIIJ|nr:YidC/Oxa1 family membrane protein insertase [Clostridiales bacterium]